MPEPDAVNNDTLFDAARAGDLNTLKTYLGRAQSANVTNEAGDTLLMLASYHAQSAVVEYLLSVGADPNQCNLKGQHPLAGVCYKGLTALVELLLAHGAEPDGAPGASRTPLMYAAMYNHAAIVSALLNAGADVKIQTADGACALDLAKQMHAVYTVEILEAL